LGRLRDPAAVPHLLAAASTDSDRFLQHAITYALIELAAPDALRKSIPQAEPRAVAAALMALDQISHERVSARQVTSILDSDDAPVRQTAHWLLARHPEWGDDLAHWLRKKLMALPETPNLQIPTTDSDVLEPLLVTFASHVAVQELLANVAIEPEWPAEARRMALRVMSRAKLPELPQAWQSALTTTAAGEVHDLQAMAVDAAYQLRSSKQLGHDLYDHLLAIADSPQADVEIRVKALAACMARVPDVTDARLAILTGALADRHPLPIRAVAADAIASASLNPRQLHGLCLAIESASPLEINRLLTPFEKLQDDQLALALVASLEQASALPSLRIDLVRAALSQCGPAIETRVAELEGLVNVDAQSQRARIAELLPLVVDGDVRRGHAVFYSPRAACSTCHRLGHAGGDVGPELTRIGEIRTPQDLLESILYPSLSFVRGYDPVVALTVDGQIVSGIVRDENADELVIVTSPDQTTRLTRAEIEDLRPGDVSVMPAGLDKQLSVRELADLVAFLKSAGGR